MTLLTLLAVVGLVAFRMTSADDRRRLFGKGQALVHELAIVAREEYQRQEPFRAKLRARTRYAILTPLLAVAIAGIFLAAASGAGALSDPATLVRWGASVGPKTTNGEWWRLLTSAFIHDGFLRMAIEVAGLVQLGMLLERLAGRPAFAAVFCAAALAGGIVNVAIAPIDVTYGSSGAIFGLYGLLLASVVRSIPTRRAAAAGDLGVIDPQHEAAGDDPRDDNDVRHETDAAMAAAGLVEGFPRRLLVAPISAFLWLAPVSIVFLLSVPSHGAFAFKADLAGFGVGLVAGIALTGGIGCQLPEPRRVLVTSAATALVLIACAVPLRGIADVRPEISRIIALEDKTKAAYQTALDRFNKGTMSADALAQLIERSIVHDLEAADAHLLSIRGVPPEHRPLVADADEYLRLRSTSWHLRAESWRNRVRARKGEAGGTLASDASWRQAKAQFRADTATRGKAEGTERASLEVFQRLKASS